MSSAFTDLRPACRACSSFIGRLIWSAVTVFGLIGAGPLLAASGTIFLVTDNSELEQGTSNLGGYLRQLGYTVMVDEGSGSSNYRTLDAAKIAQLESVDLVIVARATSSGDFANDSEPTQWNTLSAPLLLGSAYLARNNPLRWDWIAGSQTRQTVTGFTSFNDPAHPIVAGLNTDLYSAARDVDYVSTTAVGNGTLIATLDSGAAIAVWEGAGFFQGSSGQRHERRRVFFPIMRYHEGSAVPGGVFSDYSANGLQLLANAVAYAMTGSVSPGAPEIVDLVPADGTVAHPAAAGISFRVTSPEPISTGGITLAVNGVDVTSLLSVGGQPTNRLVSFNGLVSDANYQASITVSNELGTTTLAISFDTFAPDVDPPMVQSANPAQGATVSSLTQITVVFDEPVVNVGAADLQISDRPAIGVSGSGTTYTFVVERPDFGLVQISWDPGTDIVDLAGNAFNFGGPGATWQYQLVDNAPPEVVTTHPPAGNTVNLLTQIEVTFSEPVSGVDAADLIVGMTPATAVSGSLQGPYVFQIGNVDPGLVGVGWANGHGIVDQAGNPFAGGNWSYQVDPNFVAAKIRINEFLSATLSPDGLRDEFGLLEDWIELHNFGQVAVNLNGFSLTDQPAQPGKWILPSVTLQPGAFLVIHASGRDRRVVGGANRLHTSFKLNSNGDYLGLFDANSPRVVLTEFSPGFPEQRNDHSYGYDTSGQLVYFASPTPGAPNGNSSIAGVVPAPQVNVERGYFDHPFMLHVSESLAGALIRFTRDGTEPSEQNGETYVGPLEISQTTVFRVAAFKANYLPSRARTHSYLFLDQIIQQPNDPAGFPTGWNGWPADYEMDPEIIDDPQSGPLLRDALKSLPVLSLVTSTDDLFGPSNGIYTHSESRGVQWEKACSLELILTNGESGFQVDCGVQMQGNANRNPNNQPKHSFRLVFKGAYGPAKLNYQLFPDSPVNEFNTLVLRGDYNNSWLHWDPGQRLRGQRTRDAFMKDSMRAMGGLASHNRYVHLFLNGLYWGIYDPTERPDADFAASYLGGEPEEFDVVNEGEVKDGNGTAYNTMRAISNLVDNGQYELMKQYLDMTQFIDYMILHFHAANHDWGDNKNWYTVRRRAPGEGFKYVPWDGERILESQTANEVTPTDVPTGLHTKLLANAEYKLEFADRVHRHFFNGGALIAQNVADRWMARAGEMFPAIIGESARWGDYRRDVAIRNGAAPLFTYFDHFLTEQNRLLNTYFPVRSQNVLDQLRGAGLYPALAAPTFSQHGGPVPSAFNLTMSHSGGTIYYTLDGSDPRVYGAGAVAPSAQSYNGALTLNASVLVKARSRSGSSWSAVNEAFFNVAALRPPLRITEIMYNPVGGDLYEFIEIINISGAPLDVGFYSLEGVTFLFPANSILLPGQVIVLSSDNSPAAFAMRYPAVTVYGRFSGTLDNGGERVAIRDNLGRTVVSVDYDDQNGWPTAPDGNGPSLEVIDEDGDPDAPDNWRASDQADGSPGVITPTPPPGAVRFSELMADNQTAVNNAGTFPDWVELTNTGTEPVDLGGWSLSDDSDPRKFVFPAGTLLPVGEYLVVWCDTNATPGLHAGFALDRRGETVTLYDAQTNRQDGVTFGVQPTDYSLGRFAQGWNLSLPTVGAGNQAAELGSPTSLRVNEWLADPVAGQDDWLELYNGNGALPVALRGLHLSSGSQAFQIKSLSFVAPNGFVQLFATRNPGPDQLDFRLPAAGTTITLHDAGGIQLDQVSYGAQTEGVSEGRLPDGNATQVAFSGSVSPEASNYQLTYTGPILNEILARNNGVAQDSAARIADLVELYNPNPAPFDLSGMGLSDDGGAPWLFPPNTIIPGNGFLLVWCDVTRPASLVSEPDLNCGFALDGNSDEVFLFSQTGQLVDAVEYGFQVVDRSIGLVGGVWRLLNSPTPGQSNGAAAALGNVAALRINEWFANPVEGDDWFEIFNVQAQAVDLTGLFLSDEVTLVGRRNTQIPPLSFIGAQSYIKVIADGRSVRRRNHVGFNLDAQGEAIGLYAPDLSLIDAVYFGSQAPGKSEGRLPDGSAQIASFDVPTPGQPNALAPGPPFIVSEPEDLLEDEGESVAFSVAAVGLGTLSYQWYYQIDIPIAGATSPTLQLPNVQSEQQGSYHVVVQSEFGSVMSRVSSLTVLAPPSFVVHPLPQSVPVGGTATFSVRTRGTLPIGYRWRRGGTTILSEVLNSHQSSLTIPDVAPENAGPYSVVITNSVFFTPGVVSRTAGLTVVTILDTDEDGLPDVWEMENGLNHLDPTDAHQDLDGDGLTNLEEYQAGTDIRDPNSVLELQLRSNAADRALLSFQAVSNRTYSILFRGQADSGAWLNLLNVEAVSTNRSITVTNFLPAGTLERYFRLVTPLSQ